MMEITINQYIGSMVVIVAWAYFTLFVFAPWLKKRSFSTFFCDVLILSLYLLAVLLAVVISLVYILKG